MKILKIIFSVTLLIALGIGLFSYVDYRSKHSPGQIDSVEARQPTSKCLPKDIAGFLFSIDCTNGANGQFNADGTIEENTSMEDGENVAEHQKEKKIGHWSLTPEGYLRVQGTANIDDDYKSFRVIKYSDGSRVFDSADEGDCGLALASPTSHLYDYFAKKYELGSKK